MDHSALDAAHAAAIRFLDGIQERPVGSNGTADSMRAVPVDVKSGGETRLDDFTVASTSGSRSSESSTT